MGCLEREQKCKKVEKENISEKEMTK